MASNLGCIGLDTDADGFGDLMQRAYEAGEVVARRPQLTIVRWQDSSGARIVFALGADGQPLSATPSLAGGPGAILADVVYQGDDVWKTSIVDDQGEQATAVAVELEGSAFFDQEQPPSGPATIIALGVGVTFFADEDAFNTSPASQLSSDPGDAPPEYAEKGWTWPPRWSPQSVLSYGLFDAADGAHAMLNGTVLAARTAHNSLTGQQFHIARVRTVGFEAELCVAATEHALPVAGQVVSGTVYLIADLDAF
ncbi:MAG: hypothetical protein LWW77_03610 [Propionibacteriales bacterium]|nr:hypothetical protein [Propionibacteriales bacterium]